MKTRTLPLLAMMSISMTAWAQSEDGPPEVYASETVLDEDAFRDLKVEGEMVGPHGGVTMTRRIATFPPMVRLRTDFAQEMVESLDEIR
jgi:hypothetical protein